MNLEWVRTCAACPEQYDIYFEGEQVAYFRLRHGHLTVTCPSVGGEPVYHTSQFSGDGCFDDHSERVKHFREVEKEVKAWYKSQKWDKFDD